MTAETTPPSIDPIDPAAPPLTHIGSLPEVLGFSDDDLIANRTGQLSAAQRKRLERAWSRLAGFSAATVIVIILGATFAFFFGQRNDSPVLSVIGAMMTVINALIIGRLAQSRIRLDQDLRGGVIVTSGTITHTVKVFNRAATYLLEINGERLLVPKTVFFAFEDRAPYTLYRTASSKTLLSAERTESITTASPSGTA